MQFLISHCWKSNDTFFLFDPLSLVGVLGNLEVLLTLFQPEEADYVHHITASTPDLKTYLWFYVEARAEFKKYFFCSNADL